MDSMRVLLPPHRIAKNQDSICLFWHLRIHLVLIVRGCYYNSIIARNANPGSPIAGLQRGRDTFNHVGNQRFRALASLFMERYSRAVTKATKSAIVSEIINEIRQADGNFCKFKKGVWVEVGDHCAREKVGSLLRDFLHTQYRSSAKAKISRRKSDKTGFRKENQDEQSDRKLVDDTLHSDASSTSSLRWGSTKDSLGFEYWLEDDFFDIDVF
jgi:hypothetical protein